MTNFNKLDDERERMRKKRVKERMIQRKRMLRRLIIAGMALALIAVIALGYAIDSAGEKKKAAEAATIKTEKETKAKEEKKTPEEKKAEEIKNVKKEAKAAGCPKELIGLIDKNDETVDFVKNYTQNKDKTPPETIGDSFTAGEIPKLLQWDERWGYASYGTSTIAASGCGPTCMSMVISGMTGDTSVTPYRLAKYSEENGYVDEGNNTYWLFMNAAASNWGVNCWETMLDETMLAQELKEGHPVICSVGPGDFTQSGHFIVLTGYEDGKVTVNDPFSVENSEKTWVYADISSQIKCMWVFSL